MKSGAPKIDGRSAIQIYDQAIALARKYFPEPSPEAHPELPLWPNIHKDPSKRDDNDIGVALLRLFSRLAETVVRQLDRAPEKHLLAFFDFIGTDQLPPFASRSPLTFMLAKGTKAPVTVPARTKVASKDDPTVIFETVEPLTAANIEVKSAFSLNPWADKYSDHSGMVSGCEDGFFVFAGGKQIDHILYLMDEAFDCDSLISLEISFSFTNDASKVTDQWFTDLFGACSDAKGNNLVPTVKAGADGTYSLVFNNKLPEKADNGECWLAISPKEGLLAANAFVLPEIKGAGIKCTLKVDGISPDAVFFNDNSIEIKKGFYPFGQTPRIGDVFYIACDRAFSKSDATIKLSFKIKAGTASAGLVIVWEYWDGSVWQMATEVNSDGSRVFTASNAVELCLVIPARPPAVPTDLNGKKGYWIRARIDRGDFGGPGGFESSRSSEILNAIDNVLKSSGISDDKTINAVHTGLTERKVLVGVTYKQPSYAPPFIYSMSISYEYSNKLVKRCRTSNNFRSDDQDPAKAFKPYKVVEKESPALYLGLEGAAAGIPYSLYFSMKSAEYGQVPITTSEPGYEGLDPQDEASVLNWRYYNGKTWVELGVQDGTVHFTRNGIVTFLLPAELADLNLFGKDGRWIKVSTGTGKWLAPPLVKAILPNTVWAENSSFVKDEILGSSNGMPGQVFSISSKPVLEGQVIEVKEPAVPSEDELSLIGSEVGESAVRITRTESGDIREVWVKWHEVGSFSGSAPASRHYIIDRTGGRIIFGDGVRGMIPPAVANNIAARIYKSGGGKRGDVKHGVLTGMKTTIPNIEKVFNQDPASGGRDMEGTDGLIRRTPYSLRTGGRAVTAGDFEMLAAESSPYVARASCIADEESGKVVVIIAPAYAGDAPLPESALLDHVGSYLKERAYPPVSDHIRVIGPEYENVKVDVEFKPVSISLGRLAADMVRERLRAFLNPISGGRDGTGWPFGCELFHSEIASVVEDVEGVDYITKLTINDNVIGAPGTAWMTKIAANALPWAGDSDITVTPVNGEDE